MKHRFSSYLSPKLEAKTVEPSGFLGVFALEPIAAGECLGVFGGEIMTLEQLDDWNDEVRRLSIQVEEDLYLVSTFPSPGDRFNHSCDPNAWLEGQLTIRARRDIAPGEQICFDYATCDGSVYDEFTCLCGSENCRGRVTGQDWQNPELQTRYKGHFMPYLQRRIDQMTMEENRSVERRQRRIIRMPSQMYMDRYSRKAKRRSTR